MITRSRQVALLLFNEVELLRFSGAVQVLTLAGRHWNWRPFKIHAVAEPAGLISTCNQLRIDAPVSLQSCPKPEILILPGGYGASLAARNSKIVEWVDSVLTDVEACCCIGNGAMMLAATGRFAGESVSVPAATADHLREKSSVLVPNTTERLILGKQVVSARTSEGSMDLGLHLVERFLGASLRKKVQADLMLVNNDPSPIDVAALPSETTTD